MEWFKATPKVPLTTAETQDSAKLEKQKFSGLCIQFGELSLIECFVFPAQIRANQHFQITQVCASFIRIYVSHIFTMAHENQIKIIAEIIDQRIAISLIKGTWWLNQKL